MVYDAYLRKTFDHLPPLWPRSPRWPTDNVLKESLVGQLAQMINTSTRVIHMLASVNECQRNQDARWRHLLHLLKKLNPNEKRMPAEWVSLLTESGWSLNRMPWNSFDSMTSEVFLRLSNKYMVLAEAYRPPEVSIPKICDVCGKETTCECMCGEVYCSRACLRQAWMDQHRRVCEVVVENGGVAVMLTQIEMKQSLLASELRAALGGAATIPRALDPTVPEFIPGQVSETVRHPAKTP